jgi:RNA polymerase sigma-70 factor, ECF subfamily
VFFPLSDSEADIIARAGHDPAAFGELYRRHVDRVYAYIYHRIGSVPDAEDLTARTFQRALVGMSTYVDHGAPFSAWLYRIAHNLVANWHRDEARRVTVPLDGLAAVAGEEPDAVRDEASRAVAVALRSLDADRQALLVMKVQGLSNAEIAAALGRTESAVKSLYHRTLRELRDSLAGLAATSGALPEDGRQER